MPQLSLPGFPVKTGATTIWERWDDIRPDGTFKPAFMNSFNRYAYKAIGDWMYRQMVGLNKSNFGLYPPLSKSFTL